MAKVKEEVLRIEETAEIVKALSEEDFFSFLEAAFNGGREEAQQ